MRHQTSAIKASSPALARASRKSSSILRVGAAFADYVVEVLNAAQAGRAQRAVISAYKA